MTTVSGILRMAVLPVVLAGGVMWGMALQPTVSAGGGGTTAASAPGGQPDAEVAGITSAPEAGCTDDVLTACKAPEVPLAAVYPLVGGASFALAYTLTWRRRRNRYVPSDTASSATAEGSVR